MRWNTTVGVLMAIALGVTTMFAWPAHAFTLTWSNVTSYTDNSLIGSEAGGVFYNVEMDGAQVATRIAATSWILPAVGKKTAHTFRAQAVLGTGETSLWSPVYSWTSPAGNPGAPGQLRVAP